MQRIVAFDFDGTLYSRDSFSQFLIFLVKRSPWRSVVVMLCVPLLLAARLGTGGIKRSASLVLWVATVGTEASLLDSMMKEFVALSRDTDRFGRFYQDALACLQQHVACDDRVVVVSGCAQPLLGYLLASQQIEAAALGSMLERRWGGFICEWHCYGANKPVALSRECDIREIDVVYSDSDADMPLFEMAKQCVLVNARNHAIRSVGRKIDSEVIQVAWQ